MIPLITQLLPSVMDVAGRFLPEDKQKRAEAEREIEAKLTDSLAKLDLVQASPTLTLLTLKLMKQMPRAVTGFNLGGGHLSGGHAGSHWPTLTSCSQSLLLD